MIKTLFSTTAVALTLISGSAFAAGADGASFPSLNVQPAKQLSRAQVHAEAVQARARNGVVATADGSVVAPVQATAERSRAQVQAEAVQARAKNAVIITADGSIVTPRI